MNKYLVPTIIATVLVLALTACGSAAGPAAEPQVLTIGQDLEARTLDPHGDIATLVTNYHRHMFNTLVRRSNDEKLELEGDLALSWENVDPVTWEFKLREGVKFHDGSELTAEDIKWNYDRMTDAELSLHVTGFVKTIDRVEVVDPLTIRIITLEPDPVLPVRLTSGYIIPKKVFEEVGAESFGLNPVGSGPFKFIEWVKDERLVMEANPDYWEGPPQVDRLVFKPIPEVTTRMSALKTGDVDIVNKVPIQEINAIKAESNLDVLTISGGRVVFYGFDTFHPPFDDVTLRQAINYAVDVESILENVLGGYGKRTLLAPEMYFGVDTSVEPYPYDPEKAKELLAEAGYPGGEGLEFTIECATSGNTPNDQEITQAVAGELAKVGIKADVNLEEFGGFVRRWLDQEIRGMYCFSFGGVWLDMDVLMSSHFHSPRRALYYNTPELDALIEEGMSFDLDARIAAYQKVTPVIKEDAPWLFMFAADDIYGVNTRVKNWAPRSDEALWLHPVEVE